MPIAVRGVISYTLTDAELDQGRALRRKREDCEGRVWSSQDWDFTEMEEFDDEIRDTFGIPRDMRNRVAITNFMELFND